MKRYFFLSEQELFDLSSKKKSLRELKLKSKEFGDKKVYFSIVTEHNFKNFK